MAALTFKVGGDTTGLGRAVSRAKGMLSGLGNVLKTGAFAGGAAAVGGLAVSFAGLKKALDLGGRLSDVAANTGLLAGEAMVLERALADAGIGGEKLQAKIQKMQKSIVEAGDGLMTPKRALDELGLSVDELLAMRPAEQFATLQAALAGLSDPAERSARAMQIFGRSGGELGALFSNPEAMRQAAESVGVQADILTKSAGEFDRSADLLAGMGDKLRSFFVGLADYINPVLLPVLEEMNKVDLAKIGAGFGEAVLMVVEAFKTDKLGELMKESFLYAGKALVNHLVEGFLMAGVVLKEAILGVGEMLKDIFSARNLSGFGKVAAGSATSLLNDFADSPLSKMSGIGSALSLIPKGVRDDFEADMNEVAADGMDQLSGFGDRFNTRLADVMRSASEEILRSKKVLDSTDIMGAGAHFDRQKEILDGLRESVRLMRDGAAEAAGDETKAAIPKLEPLAEGGAMERVMRPIVTSLGRLGGDGLRGGRTELRMSRERNGLLKQIARNTEGMAARYA